MLVGSLNFQWERGEGGRGGGRGDRICTIFPRIDKLVHGQLRKLGQVTLGKLVATSVYVRDSYSLSAAATPDSVREKHEKKIKKIKNVT